MRQARVGGTEQVLNLLARHLCERGHEVTVVCRSHAGPEHTPHPAVRFVTLRRPVLGSAWRMRAFAEDVERHVERADYDVVLGLGKTWSQDVLRTGGGSHAAYLEHARPHEQRSAPDRLADAWLKDRLALGIERRAFAPGAYRRVIANSELVRRDVIERYGVPPERIEVIHNGVDLQRFGPHHRAAGRALRRELDIDDADPVVAFVGGGFRRKGLPRLIEALPEVLRAHPRLTLLVVGRDSARRELERRAGELGVAHGIRFLGRRTDPEVCYAAADLYCLPTWYDSFGFSVLEAMATGLPVITTDRAGAAELVEHDVHGAVLDGEAGPVEIAAALLAWLEPERRQRTGRGGVAEAVRARAESCDVRRSLERIEQVLVDAARSRD